MKTNLTPFYIALTLAIPLGGINGQETQLEPKEQIEVEDQRKTENSSQNLPIPLMLKPDPNYKPSGQEIAPPPPYQPPQNAKILAKRTLSDIDPQMWFTFFENLIQAEENNQLSFLPGMAHQPSSEIQSFKSQPAVEIQTDSGTWILPYFMEGESENEKILKVSDKEEVLYIMPEELRILIPIQK